MTQAVALQAWRGLRHLMDRLAVYLPVYLMALVAFATFLLVRNTPVFGPPSAQPAATHDPDYFVRGFTLRSFDPQGRLKSELSGTLARHYPDTDTLEIESPRVRAVNERGEVVLASARRALSNADGSEVQLFDDAVITRQAGSRADGRPYPAFEVRGEFLHVFVETEQLRSNRPVVLTRGNDRFTADSLDYDRGEQLLKLQGRVRGVIPPVAAAAAPARSAPVQPARPAKAAAPAKPAKAVKPAKPAKPTAAR